MIYRKKLLRTALMASVLSGVITVSGCDDDGSATSQLRVIHTSPDAPAVNVKLDSNVIISDLNYAESSGFQRIASGLRDIAVEAIIPGGNADVITVSGFNFEDLVNYTVLAVDNTDLIEALVANESAASPGGDEVAIAVVHASPAAATVDVYVTAPDTLIDSVDKLKQVAWVLVISQGYVAYDLNRSYYAGFNRLQQAGRLEWALEDSNQLLNRNLYEIGADQAIDRLKGARNLRGRRRAAAARLFDAPHIFGAD